MISGVTDGVRKRALRAMISELQNHRFFANNRIVKEWRLWDGSKKYAEPTVSVMPMVQVRIIGGPVRRVASTRKPGGAATWTLETKPTIVIEVWVAGSDQGDLCNVADAIYEVFGVQDDTARKDLQLRLGRAGIRDWELTSEILPTSIESYDDKSICGIGTYQLTIFVEG